MELNNYYNSFFSKRWQYLDEDLEYCDYFSPNDLNYEMWKHGNGKWEGYDVSIDKGWDENLIYIL